MLETLMENFQFLSDWLAHSSSSSPWGSVLFGRVSSLVRVWPGGKGAGLLVCASWGSGLGIGGVPRPESTPTVEHCAEPAGRAPLLGPDLGLRLDHRQCSNDTHDSL